MFNPTIQVIRQKNELERTVYIFRFLETPARLALSAYAEETRETTRHKFKPRPLVSNYKYSPLVEYNTYNRDKRRREIFDLIVLPEDVQQEARENFIQLFKDMPVNKEFR